MYNTNVQTQTMMPVQMNGMHFLNSDTNMNLEPVNNIVPMPNNLSNNMTMNNQLLQNNIVPDLSQTLNVSSRINLQKIAPNSLGKYVIRSYELFCLYT